MSLRGKLLVAGLIAVLGVATLVFAFARGGGVRDYLAGAYTRVSATGSSAVYTATQRPSAVFEDIRSNAEPANTVIQPDGYYLRYSDDIVAVTAEGQGSRIYLDDEDRGYQRWFPVIGPVWGTFRGGGGDFRGGGPGSGK